MSQQKPIAALLVGTVGMLALAAATSTPPSATKASPAHAIERSSATTQQQDYDQRLRDLGLQLPPKSAAVGIYKSVVVVDNMAYLAGHIPRTANGDVMRGKVGDNVDLEEAQAAARQSGLAMLASLQAELGSLNRVKRLVKTTGMVNCTPDFTDQPRVVNGCSQLFKDIFGEDSGVGARSAVGLASLPAGAIVEIEAIFELRPDAP